MSTNYGTCLLAKPMVTSRRPPPTVSSFEDQEDRPDLPPPLSGTFPREYPRRSELLPEEWPFHGSCDLSITHTPTVSINPTITIVAAARAASSLVAPAAVATRAASPVVVAGTRPPFGGVLRRVGQ